MSEDRMVSVATAWLMVVVLFLPRSGKFGLRMTAAAAFLVLGESLLVSGAVSDLMEVALLYLSAGMLMLAEIAAGASNPLVPLIWIACGGLGMWKHDELAAWAARERPWVAGAGLVGALVLVPLAVLGWRRATRPGYKSDELTGV